MPRSVIRNLDLPVLDKRRAFCRYVFVQLTRLSNFRCFPLGSISSLSFSLRPNCCASISVISDVVCSFPSPVIFNKGSMRLWKSGTGIPDLPYVVLSRAVYHYLTIPEKTVLCSCLSLEGSKTSF